MRLKTILQNEWPNDPVEISITYVDDPTLKEMNRRYLQHDWETDVISFSLGDEHDPESMLLGDIYVSYERAKQQALQYQISYEEEINRLTIHGILHLLGYDHKSAAEKEIMRQKEDYWLQADPSAASRD